MQREERGCEREEEGSEFSFAVSEDAAKRAFDEMLVNGGIDVGYDMRGAEGLSDDWTDFGAEPASGRFSAMAADLRDLASGWQNAARAEAYAYMQRGRFPAVSPDREGPLPERVFQCSKVFNITEWDTAGGLYEALRSGTVVAEVVGRTGVGKSTRLAVEVARACGARVLQICPDVALKARHSQIMSKVMKPLRMWPQNQGPAVCLITPQDFCGRFMGEGWRDMISLFEVVIVDEAHKSSKWYRAIRAAFSTKVAGAASLLLVSATMPGRADLQTNERPPQFIPKDIMEVVRDPSFIRGPFAVDRTLVVVESNTKVRDVTEALVAVGIDAIALEAGASEQQVSQVADALQVDSPAMRMVVAHERFGCGHNFPVERVLTTGLRMISKVENGVYSYTTQVLSREDIKQHLGRAERGSTAVARVGVVFLDKSQIASENALHPSERFGAYVLLVAMGILPGKDLVDAVADMLPFGLGQRVAVSLMRVSALPEEITMRFLAADGRIPPKYAKSLERFADADGLHLMSVHDECVGQAEWPSVPAFAPLGINDGPMVKIPVNATGELAALLTFICAAAEGIYVPEVTYRITDDGYESGPDRKKNTYVRRVRRAAPVVMPVIEGPKNKEYVYSYDVPVADQATYGRRSGFVAHPTVAQHLRADNLQLGVPEVSEVTVGERKFMRLDFAVQSPVTLESPGGTSVLEFPADLWACMVSGDPLHLPQFKRMLRYAGTDAAVFATSSAFTDWNNVWLCVLRSLHQEANIEYMRRRNIVPHALVLIGKLWERYVRGMQEAIQASHSTVNLWTRLVQSFGGDVLNRRNRAIAEGRAPVAQTDEFKTRLFDIRAAFAEVTIAMETAGFYSAYSMTRIQRILPISRPVGHAVIDSVFRGQAEPWRRRRHEFEHMRERFERM